MKRFQECNWIVKLWRLRWYIPVPFQWLSSMYIKPVITWDTSLEQNGTKWAPRGKNLWKLLKGSAQGKMRWVWTHDEVMERIKKWKNNTK